MSKQETVEVFRVGNGTVGVTAQKAGDVGIKAYRHVKIKASLGNTDNVYVGHDENVTASNGYELDAGEEVDVPVDSLDKVWVIGGVVGQNYFWLVA